MKKSESSCSTTFIFRERYNSWTDCPMVIYLHSNNQICDYIQSITIDYKKLCIPVLREGGQPIHALADGPVQGDGREG